MRADLTDRAAAFRALAGARTFEGRDAIFINGHDALG